MTYHHHDVACAGLRRLRLWGDFLSDKTFAFTLIATCSDSFYHCHSSHLHSHSDVWKHCSANSILSTFCLIRICIWITHKWNLIFRNLSLKISNVSETAYLFTLSIMNKSHCGLFSWPNSSSLNLRIALSSLLLIVLLVFGATHVTFWYLPTYAHSGDINLYMWIEE